MVPRFQLAGSMRVAATALPCALVALSLLVFAGCGGGGEGPRARLHVPPGKQERTTDSTGQAAEVLVVPHGPSGGGFSEEQRSQLEKKGLSGKEIEGLEVVLEVDARKPEAGHRGGSRKPAEHPDSPTATASFKTPGADNSIPEFGTEAPTSEFEAAAAALYGYLDARAHSDWERACSYISRAAAASLSQLTDSGGASCARSLAALSEGVAAAALREAAVAEVGALRVEGQRAFLLFHGAGGADYFMPVARQGSAWKVAAIAPSPLS